MNIFQIGAGLGEDHVSELMKEYPDAVLHLVEPNPIHFDKLTKQYPNARIYNFAISDRNEQARLYYSIDDAPGFEVASFHPQHIINHGYTEQSLRSHLVAAVTLDWLFEQSNVDTIDLLLMDIEGMEEKVLSVFDFDRWKIPIIQIEMIHINQERLRDLMEANGYELTNTSFENQGYDRIFQRKKGQVL